MTDTTDRLPYEYSLFQLAFAEPGAISHFVQTLPTEDVGLPDGNVGLNQFYMAICEFYDKTGCDPIDPSGFKEWLSSATDIEVALGGREGVEAFFSVLSRAEPTTPQAVSSVLRMKSSKQRQQDYAAELQTILRKKERTDADQSRIGLLATMIRTIEEETGYDPLANLMTGHDIALMAESLWEIPDFLPTPFTALNKALGYSEKGGIIKSAVTGILAPSGQGKSTFAKVLTNFWVENGFTVLYINYEETAAHWHRIQMTQLTGHNAYLGEEMEELEKRHATEMFKEKMHSWGDRIMVMHDPETAYFEDLERWLRDVINRRGVKPDAIVIDTIQSMFLKSAGGKPRWSQYEEMMVKLEKLGKDTGAAIVLTAQENTNRMKERREVVMQSDTGGAIAIVQKCSVTMHLVQPKKGGEDVDYVEIQIPKNRITGTSFSHNPPKVRYIDEIKSFVVYDELDGDYGIPIDDGFDETY